MNIKCISAHAFMMLFFLGDQILFLEYKPGKPISLTLKKIYQSSIETHFTFGKCPRVHDFPVLVAGEEKKKEENQ